MLMRCAFATCTSVQKARMDIVTYGRKINEPVYNTLVITAEKKDFAEVMKAKIDKVLEEMINEA